MDSQIFRSIGIDGIDPAIYIIILTVMSFGLLITCIVQGVKLHRERVRLDKLMAGKDGRSLEKKIDQIMDDNRYLLGAVDDHKDSIKYLTRRLSVVFQKSALLKYNAHQKMGGELSFILVLLDENNTGILINSVNVTEGSYVYSKVIENGKSKIELGPEEIRALEQAIETELPR